MTAPAPASHGFSTSAECTALAQAITIRARLRLAQAYATLHDSWVAEDRTRRDAASGMPPGAQPTNGRASSADQPPARSQPVQSAPAGHRGIRTRRTRLPHLLPWIRNRTYPH